jgi:predicted phosphodiesterase
MRVAALYDIHGNLPALEAVLEEVRRAAVDRIVVGGDVIPGPMPRECLQLLLDLGVPIQFIHGNCELAALAQMDAMEGGEVGYWGTSSGRPLPRLDAENMRWSAERLHPEYRPLLASWPRTLRLEIEGLGTVLFCHATPRSEIDVFTRRTPEDGLRPLFEGLGAPLVVCGHTHMQFDRMIGRTRVVNAGSVGNPFGAQGAFWLLLAPGVEPRRTHYDFAEAARRIRATAYPGAEDFARGVLEPPVEDKMVELFGTVEVR